MEPSISQKKHKIRLHGPWQATVVAGEIDSEKRSFDATVESDWESILGKDFCGLVRYQRKFNCPTGLTPNQQVAIVVTEVDFFGECRLNERELGSLTFGNAGSFEVGGLLESFNNLIIDVRLTAEDQRDRARESRFGLAGGLIGSVYLEIEDG